MTDNDKMREFVAEVKQLCKDFSDQRDRPYMGDVHAALDGLYEQWQAAQAEQSVPVDWPEAWVDQHVEPKTLHKPVLVPLEVLIRTEFELTHSERGGDYDTKILGILRDIIAQADAAIAAEGEK